MQVCVYGVGRLTHPSGESPVSISAKMSPTPHQSTVPPWASRDSTSGASICGVPASACAGDQTGHSTADETHMGSGNRVLNTSSKGVRHLQIDHKALRADGSDLLGQSPDTSRARERRCLCCLCVRVLQLLSIVALARFLHALCSFIQADEIRTTHSAPSDSRLSSWSPDRNPQASRGRLS
eukprot:5204484-Pleurochrysis_carterae.AAC.4